MVFRVLGVFGVLRVLCGFRGFSDFLGVVCRASGGFINFLCGVGMFGA